MFQLHKCIWEKERNGYIEEKNLLELVYSNPSLLELRYILQPISNKITLSYYVKQITCYR